MSPKNQTLAPNPILLLLILGSRMIQTRGVAVGRRRRRRKPIRLLILMKWRMALVVDVMILMRFLSDPKHMKMG